MASMAMLNDQREYISKIVTPFWDDEIPIFQAIHASKQPGELGLHRLTHRMRQIRLDLLRDHQGIP